MEKEYKQIIRGEEILDNLKDYSDISHLTCIPSYVLEGLFEIILKSPIISHCILLNIYQNELDVFFDLRIFFDSYYSDGSNVLKDIRMEQRNAFLRYLIDNQINFNIGDFDLRYIYEKLFLLSDVQ